MGHPVNILISEDHGWGAKLMLFGLGEQYDPFVKEVTLFVQSYLHSEVIAWGPEISGVFDLSDALWLSIFSIVTVSDEVFLGMGADLCRLVYAEHMRDAGSDSGWSVGRNQFQVRFEAQPGWGALCGSLSTPGRHKPFGLLSVTRDTMHTRRPWWTFSLL